MVGHGGRFFQRAAVLEIGGDAGGPETVVADLRRNICSRGAAADHNEGIGLGQGNCRKPTGAAAALLAAAGAAPVSLGARILRAETAAVYMLAAWQLAQQNDP